MNNLNYTKKIQFCMWQYYIFPKARGNKNKQCTHSTPLKGVLFNISIMTKTLKTSFYLFSQFYFTLFLASQTGHNVPLSLPQPGLDQKKYQFMTLIPDRPDSILPRPDHTETIYRKPEINTFQTTTNTWIHTWMNIIHHAYHYQG